MITINFHKTNTPMGLAIRAYTGGNISHISGSIGSEKFEATIKDGVHQGFDESTIIETFTFENGDLESALKFAKEQLGKGYDWLGIVSFIWKQVPEHKGLWYCSELWMVLLMKFLRVDSKDYDQKQSPYDFYKLCKLLKALNY